MDKNEIFKQILAENKDRIYRICCAYENDADEREDLFQEILVNIWKSLDRFENRSSLNTWVYRIAVNVSMLHVRKSLNAKKINHEYYNEILIQNDTEDREEKIILHKKTEKLFRCINKLKKIDRLVISMVLNEISYNEIAEITGLTANHIGVKINRIKKELLKLMESENGI